MNLSDYPDRIAALSRAVNELDLQLTQLKRELATVEFAIDAEVFFDPQWRNEKQREIKRYELLTCQTVYPDLLSDFNALTKQKADAVTELESARNQFSAAKLETRLAIAQHLVGSECQDLVGV